MSWSWPFLRVVISHSMSSRVCEVQLKGNHEFTLRQQKYRVSEALKTGEASALFGMDLAGLHARIRFDRL